MLDREKVIKDLEAYRDRDFIREGITVFDSNPRYRKMIINNALELLKSQRETIDELISADKLLKEQTDEIKELRSMVEFWKEKALHT